MGKILSGINDLDHLIDSLYVGDNVVWEVEAGTSSEIFIQNFINQSVTENQNVIYVSFNKSPHSILQQIGEMPSTGNFKLLDCFTSGKGKNDRAFIKFYINMSAPLRPWHCCILDIRKRGTQPGFQGEPAAHNTGSLRLI